MLRQKKSNELISYAYSHLFGLNTTGLRYFTVYGPWGRPDMAYYLFTKNIINGEKIDVYNYGDMKRDFTYIDDIVDGTISAINHNYQCEVFNLGNNRSEKITEMIEIIEKRLDTKAIINLLPMQKGDVRETFADIEHTKMVLSLEENFNQNCYMSCALLKSRAGVKKQFTDNIQAYYWPDGSFRESVFVRYFLIMLVGFGPLWVLSFFSKLKKKIKIFNKNFTSLFPILLILTSPVLVLFAMGYVWGRWVNISYTFSVLFYFYLAKNDLIKIDLKSIDIFLKKQNKKIIVLFFIIFSFGWNPKTVVTGDVASFPGYRIPVKIVKFTIWRINKLNN